MAAPRTPNILITGTPGTGKTTTAAELAQLTGWRHVNVGDWVKQKELHNGWDDEFDCWIVDEDKVASNCCLLLAKLTGDSLPPPRRRADLEATPLTLTGL